MVLLLHGLSVATVLEKQTFVKQDRAVSRKDRPISRLEENRLPIDILVGNTFADAVDLLRIHLTSRHDNDGHKLVQYPLS